MIESNIEPKSVKISQVSSKYKLLRTWDMHLFFAYSDQTVTNIHVVQQIERRKIFFVHFKTRFLHSVHPGEHFW